MLITMRLNEALRRLGSSKKSFFFMAVPLRGGWVNRTFKVQGFCNFFLINRPMIFIYKLYKKNLIQPSEEPREHHLGEVRPKGYNNFIKNKLLK